MRSNFLYTHLNMAQISLTLAMVLLSSCTGGGGSKFSDLLDVDPQQAGVVEITALTPTGSPVVMSTTSETTFAITVDPQAGNNLNYVWTLDGAQLSSTNSFHILSGASLLPGNHTLAVSVTNGKSTDSHNFVIHRNTPPVITARSPAATGASVTCGSGSLALSVSTSDADNDARTYTWKVNGMAGTTFFVNQNSNGAGATADFVPNCTLSGTATISVEVRDGHDVTSISPAWTVSIINSGVANIGGVSPNSSPYVIIPSSGSKVFNMLDVTGVPPISYSWELEGTPLPGEVSTSLTLHASTLDPLPGLGPYTLTAKVSDGTGAESSFNVQVLLNKAPVLSGPAPSATSLARNYDTPNMTFSVNSTDENADVLRYIWIIDGATYEPPFSGLPNYLSINNASPHQLIFNPNLSLVGSHTISVRAREDRATDFEFSNTNTWTVQFNHFSDACNQLQAGQICTLVGAPGIMTDTNNDGWINALTEPYKLRINYSLIHKVLNNDGLTVVNNFFFSDSSNHAVWYYNRSDKAQSVLGKTLQPGEIKMLVGNGASGRSVDSSPSYSYNLYKLSSPQGMYYDGTANMLYIADRGNHRIVRIDSNGQGLRVFGNETNLQCAAGFTNCNTDNELATNHVCGGPVEMAFDNTAKRMYVTCSSTHAIKEVNITNANPATWTARILVGRLNGSNQSTAATTNGTTLAAGTGQVNTPWALAMDSQRNLYFTQSNGGACYVRAINLNSAGGITLPNSAGSGTQVLAQNQVLSVFGQSTCSAPAGGTQVPNTVRYFYPRGLAIHEVAGVLEGFFVTSTDAHRVIYSNARNTTKTFGSVAVGAYLSQTIWGNGTGNYSGNTKPASTNTVFNPYGITIDNNSLILVDFSNNRLRTLDIGTNDGNIDTLLTITDPKSNSSPDSPAVDAAKARLNFISDLLFRSSDNSLLVADTTEAGLNMPTHFQPDGKTTENNRVRKLDLSTGLLDTVLGMGYGTYTNMQSAHEVLLHGLRGLGLVADNLLVLDRHWVPGGTRSCGFYLYNQNSPSGTFYGSPVDNGKVGLIAGNYTQGCGTESANGTAAAAARMEPFSMNTTQDDTIYFTQFRRHCIMKVDVTGNLTAVAGLCGAAGNAEGALTSARFEYPLSIVKDPRYPTNMLVIDQSNKTTSEIKYINLSGSDVEIAGVSALSNEVKRIITINDGYAIGLTVYADPSDPGKDMICYTSGSGMNTINATNTNTTNPNLLTVAENPDGQVGFHRVTCVKRSDGAKEIVIGADSSALRAGSQLTTEHEGLGIDSSSGIKKIKASLFTPYGLTFDSEGNLYIGERDGKVIRKVKKWW